MTKFQLNRADAPWDYPSLGFRADTGTAILDGSTFDPPITTPPDVWWTVYTGGLGETGITRYTFPVVPASSPPEPTDGHFLVYDANLNTYVPAAPVAKHAPALGLYFPEAEGALGGGVNDAAAVAACLATAAAANGTVHFGQTFSLASAVEIPNGVRKITAASGAGVKAHSTKPLTSALLYTGANTAPVRGVTNLIIEGVTFDGASLTPNRWLQNPTTGATITDPQNDYFANGGKINDPAHDASAAAVAASQTLGSAGNLTLTSTPYTPSSVRKVTITSAGNDSGRTFTVTGTDYNNAALTSAVTGKNAGTATTSVVFKTVTQIAVDGATAATVTAGVAAFDIFGTVAEGRRNPNYTQQAGMLDLNVCEDVTVRDCWFIDHYGVAIYDRGSKNIDILGNRFYRVGKNDGAFPAIWTQSYGTPGGGDAWFTDSENINIVGNQAANLERSFALFAPTKGGRLIRNEVDGWGEACIFVPSNLHYSGGYSEIAHNKFKNGVVSDFVSIGIEINSVADIEIHHNHIENVDGQALSLPGLKRSTVHHNSFKDCYGGFVNAYGPFAERYAWNVGTSPIAGVDNPRADGAYISIGTLDGIGMSDVRIHHNRFRETRATYPSLFAQFKSGTANMSTDTIIEENTLDVPAAMTFLNKTVTSVWDTNMGLSIRGNMGHASEAPVVHTKQFASAETGIYTVTAGFRPRLVRIYAAENNGANGRVAVGEMTWNRAATRNDFSLAMATTSGTGQWGALFSTDVIRLTDAAGTARFVAEFGAWTEEGFTVNVTTAAAITNVRFVCVP